MRSSNNISTDVIVVGAGIAGVTAASMLGQQGLRVILIDPRASFPPLFRCEKLEPDQSELLQKFGLLEHLLPHARCIREVLCGYDGRCFKVDPRVQYGMHYSEMVNVLREHVPAGVEIKLGHVEHIANSDDIQRVKLKSGEELTARLVVLASGVNSELQTSLGFDKHLVQNEQSVSFGFSIARLDGLSFRFDATTYYPNTNSEGIDYLALFVMGAEMRANLFTFRSLNEPWVAQFLKHPAEVLEKAMPKLSQMIGKFRVTGKVDIGRVDLVRMRSVLQPGVVLIGDAYQIACPSTGLGFTKVFTDVDVLAECAREWFATPGMSREKIAKYYDDGRKKEVDDRALELAHFERHSVLGGSLFWKMKRLQMRVPKLLGRRFKDLTFSRNGSSEALQIGHPVERGRKPVEF